MSVSLWCHSRKLVWFLNWNWTPCVNCVSWWFLNWLVLSVKFYWLTDTAVRKWVPQLVHLPLIQSLLTLRKSSPGSRYLICLWRSCSQWVMHCSLVKLSSGVQEKQFCWECFWMPFSFISLIKKLKCSLNITSLLEVLFFLSSPLQVLATCKLSASLLSLTTLSSASPGLEWS